MRAFFKKLGYGVAAILITLGVIIGLALVYMAVVFIGIIVVPACVIGAIAWVVFASMYYKD